MYGYSRMDAQSRLDFDRDERLHPQRRHYFTLISPALHLTSEDPV